MLDVLLSVLGNSHFEAYVGGGLAGVVYGALFNALGQRRPSGLRSEPEPAKVQEVLLLQPVPSRTSGAPERRSSSSGQDDGVGVLLLMGLALLVASLVFAAYLNWIADAFYLAAACVAAFSVTATVTAALAGRMNTLSWWMHALAPVVTALVSLWIASQAHAAIDPSVVAYARGLIDGQANTLAAWMQSGWTFYRALKEYANWLVLILLAFVVLFFATVIAGGQCVHYIALANVRDGGGRFWFFVARWTLRFGGWGALTLSWICLLAAWFLASGRAYHFLVAR